MKTKVVKEPLQGEHGIICSLPHDFYGYFGWPSVAVGDDGILFAVASGLRNAHVCPFGRTVIFESHDQGSSWSGPIVLNDSPLDDRDAGVLCLGGGGILVSWFTSDTRTLDWPDRISETDRTGRKRYEDNLNRFSDSAVQRWLGSWIRLSRDNGETWGPPIRVPGTAPHGPIRLSSGRLLYLAKEFPPTMDDFNQNKGGIVAFSSSDGEKWQRLGEVPVCPGTDAHHYCEPHVCERGDGSLLGLIRFQNHGTEKDVEKLGFVSFSLMQTVSSDGGRTWSTAEPLGFLGSPPHVMKHSSGTLICVYGYRKKPYGQRVMFSHNDGLDWDFDFILRDDGPDGDLGYPSNVELADGSLLTVYYQKVGSVDEKCSFLWSRWTLPA